MVGGMSRIIKDCPPFMLVEGSPAEVRGVNTVGLKRRNIGPEAQEQIKQAYRILYREGLSTRQGVERIRAEISPGPEIEYLLQFIEQSERGITK
jgi:UDP-N-acetylglucosamine acyltransferase